MKILHLEYSSFFSKIVKDMIDKMGYSVIQSKNGNDIYKILATEDIRLVITSLELSDTNAKDIISELKNSKYYHIPIIIMTSNKIDDAKEKLENLDVENYIKKQDLTFEDFYQMVDDILDI